MMRRSARRALQLAVVGALVGAPLACSTVHVPASAPQRQSHDDGLGVIAQTLLDSAASKYRRASRSYDPARGYPRSTQPDGRWMTVPVSDWTSGFFPGTLWYLHEYTLDPALREQAERFTAPIAGVMRGSTDHDLGFQFFTSFGHAYRVTRDERFHAPLLDAARLLAGRYDARVGAIKAWDRSEWKFPVLVETTMNLELLLWSASHGGDSAWTAIARRVGEQTLAKQIRPDGSTFQLADYDPQTGALLRLGTRQGLADSSTWARGQAWGLYGFTMLHRETRDPRFLAAAQRLAGYVIARLPDDGIPCWDFQAAGCPGRAQRDASAAAIMASALLELSTFVRGEEAERYRDVAERMLGSLTSSAYLAPNESDALLLHSVGDRPHDTEVDVGIVYADYYFVEALLRYLQLSGQSGIRVLETR